MYMFKYKMMYEKVFLEDFYNLIPVAYDLLKDILFVLFAK